MGVLLFTAYSILVGPRKDISEGVGTVLSKGFDFNFEAKGLYTGLKRHGLRQF